MKRRLNVLCLLVMLVISYSLIESLYYFSVGFNAGVEMSQTPEGIKQAMTMKPIAVTPSGFSQFSDSVYNERRTPMCLLYIVSWWLVCRCRQALLRC